MFCADGGPAVFSAGHFALSYLRRAASFQVGLANAAYFSALTIGQHRPPFVTATQTDHIDNLFLKHKRFMNYDERRDMEREEERLREEERDERPRIWPANLSWHAR